MNIPAKAAIQGEGLENAANKKESTPKEEDNSFEAQVNRVAKQAERGTDGKYVLSDDLSPELKYATILELRRRDTQSEYTKVNQKTKALEAENKALTGKALGNVEIELTAEQAEEMDDLKFADPEAWRKKINKLEREARAKYEEDLVEEIGKISGETLAKDEKERRGDVLKDYIEANPGFDLTDDIIQNDIPPRITKKLETGAITFEAFLDEISDYLKTGKVIKKDDETHKSINLSKIGGGSSPDKHAEKEDIIESYKKEIF